MTLTRTEYEIQSVVPTSEFNAWFRDENGQSFPVQLDAIAVAKYRVVEGVKPFDDVLRKGRDIVGINFLSYGWLIANEDANFICILRCGITPEAGQPDESHNDET